MAKSKPRTLPAMQSLDALVEFFDTHDMGDYWGAVPEAQFEVDIQRRTHLVAIDADLAAKLAEIARARHISTPELINSWLKEKIAEQ